MFFFRLVFFVVFILLLCLSDKFLEMKTFVIQNDSEISFEACEAASFGEDLEANNTHRQFFMFYFWGFRNIVKWKTNLKRLTNARASRESRFSHINFRKVKTISNIDKFTLWGIGFIILCCCRRAKARLSDKLGNSARSNFCILLV